MAQHQSSSHSQQQTNLDPVHKLLSQCWKDESFLNMLLMYHAYPENTSVKEWLIKHKDITSPNITEQIKHLIPLE